MASFSPILGVTKPRTSRPTVRPIQKPVAVMPEAKGAAWRMLIMKATIQPPSATSMPT